MLLPEDLHCLTLRQCLTRLPTANRSRVSIRGWTWNFYSHLVWSPRKIWLLFLILCVCT